MRVEKVTVVVAVRELKVSVKVLPTFYFGEINLISVGEDDKMVH